MNHQNNHYNAAAGQTGDFPLTSKAIDALACAGLALERLEASHNEKQAQDNKLAGLRPRVSQTLISTGLIEEQERADLEGVLADPVATLELLEKTAQHYAQTISDLTNVDGRQRADAGAVGTVVSPSVKSASHSIGATVPGSLDSSYAGARTSRLKDSDRAYYQQVLGFVPDDVTAAS